MRRIVPSITTLRSGPSTWESKVAEIAPLGLGQVALFVTGLSEAERVECYRSLERVRLVHAFSIPFVHAVSTMVDEEYLYLIRVFGTERFNLHPVREYPLPSPPAEEIRKRIFIENSGSVFGIVEEDLVGFGGICFDLSHLEDTRRVVPESYDTMLELTATYRVGANHISAVDNTPTHWEGGLPRHSNHLASGKDVLRYPTKLDPAAFSDLCALELDNSLAEQVAFIPTVRQAMHFARRGRPPLGSRRIGSPLPLFEAA